MNIVYSINIINISNSGFENQIYTCATINNVISLSVFLFQLILNQVAERIKQYCLILFWFIIIVVEVLNYR